METADREVLRTAVDWLTAGETVYLATVAKTFGSSPRPPGSLAALRTDGRFVGSVSGGCMEEDLVARLRGDRLPEKFPAVIAYGVTQDGGAALRPALRRQAGAGARTAGKRGVAEKHPG